MTDMTTKQSRFTETNNTDLNNFDPSKLTVMAMGEFGNNPLYLDRWGFRPTPQTDIDLLPHPEAVKLAREWFRRYGECGSKFNYDYNSYQITGFVKRMATTENTNSSCPYSGDVIAAALSEGFSMIPEKNILGFPINAFFNIILPKNLKNRVSCYMAEPLLIGPNNEPYLGTQEQKKRFGKYYGTY